ncbi:MULTISPECIES: MFS transporter [unclassified Paenibacillus]|uniref:MFS transporter n=1 Tax=unclassified Paenibacillus TaxID=185978 RepID=UPI001AE146A8|nr:MULTISPECIES: MFS transporter [unclassified Paenibacillus]MBP1154521.1 DHA2 family metal-tetracycline-proton antiporter-like MFS transporter [Paenibacillus sp. PvP091]MBP1170095.1 DHA2 family metal-tetracycline-proton antiporter-like MFS transporter [Paenibacillus sp. PvR098]MBP2441123.1 DHA2 family metal-tetracycline-proton antiporter-like MFS transporter [Paenibacillus sp. PvP052]
MSKASPASQIQIGEKLIRVLFFTLILSVMNATMFNVALPSISQEFQLSPSQVSWIVTGYIIVYAVGSVTYGKLADTYRLKDLLTFGFIFFSLGSIVGLIATEFWMIIAGRILQSIGASVIPAVGMLIPVRYFPPDKRGRALGTTTAGLALGTAVGPIVAGFVTSLASWRFLFCLSLLVLLTLPFFRKYLDDTKGQAEKTDLLGGGLMATTIGLLLLAVTNGAWTPMVLGVIMLVLFVWRIRRAAHPFIQPALFRNKQYTYGILIAFLSTGLSFGIPFMTPLMLTNMNHLAPAIIGFVMFPGALIASLLGRTGGKIADGKGNAQLIYTAVTLLFISFSSLSLVAGLSPLIVMLFLVFGNVGQTFMQIAMSNLVSRTLPKEQAGVGMGLLMMVNFISGATATTLISKMLDFSTSSFQFNPFLLYSPALIYSNIFAVLAIMVIVVSIIFYFRLGGGVKKAV